MYVKSKTVCTGVNFHKFLWGVLGWEIPANSSYRTSGTITATQGHPYDQSPPKWFQALEGCLRPTTKSEAVGKEPRCVFKYKMEKYSNMSFFLFAHTPNSVLHILKRPLWSLLTVSELAVSLKQPSRAWERFEGNCSYMGDPGWLRWFRMFYRINLPGISQPKTPQRETTLCENLRPCKQFNFWH